jgi:hypothetical protein
LSVVRPWEEPFRSKRLWMRYSEQNRLPITTKRVWNYIEMWVTIRLRVSILGNDLNEIIHYPNYTFWPPIGLTQCTPKNFVTNEFLYWQTCW